MDFGPAENLFVAKLAAAMPWFVNARLDAFGAFPAARRYRLAVRELLALDGERFERFAPELRRLDADLSAQAVKAGERHYAIRYNATMGVRSDFFLSEEAAPEWNTAAARPVPRQLSNSLAGALAAAANEVC